MRCSRWSSVPSRLKARSISKLALTDKTPVDPAENATNRRANRLHWENLKLLQVISAAHMSQGNSWGAREKSSEFTDARFKRF